MTTPELDQLDLKILDALQRQGRMSMTELGQQIGLSTSPVAERVKSLEQRGVITGYHTQVNPAALGRALLVFVEITLSSKSPRVFEKVRRELQHIPAVLECHLVSGSFDYLVKARLAEMAQYRELLGSILKRIPVPSTSTSYVVMEEIKDTTVLDVSS